MTLTTNKVGERLDEVVGFDFSKPLTQNVRENLTVKLCGQFLDPLTEAIQKFVPKDGDDVIEETIVEDQLGIMETMEAYLKSPTMKKIFHERNLICNAVMPLISATEVPDWEQRDLPICISFGFPGKVPACLRARYRSNKLLEVIHKHILAMFPNRSVIDVDHNKDAKVPYLLCDIDDVSVIIKISVKPFNSPQFLAKDVVDMYKTYDDRFITIANYFYHHLWQKVVTKRDLKKAKSVIPKLCSIKMMVIHFFKHYDLLPADINSLEAKMKSLKVSGDSKPYSLGTLYFLFLDYYLDIVSLEKDYLEITTGEVVEKKSIGLTNLNILSISDIFDDHYPGERVNDTLIFKRILKASFNSIHKYLNNRTGDVLNDLRVIPIRPRNVEL